MISQAATLTMQNIDHLLNLLLGEAAAVAGAIDGLLKTGTVHVLSHH